MLHSGLSRLKWMRTTGVSALAGSPVVTSQPSQQVIVGGTNLAGDPILGISTTGTAQGGVLWSTGSGLTPAITSVTTSMVYDPTASVSVTRPSNMLYVNAGSKLYGLHITGSSLAGTDYYTCSVGQSAGPPALVGGGATSKVRCCWLIAGP